MKVQCFKTIKFLKDIFSFGHVHEIENEFNKIFEFIICFFVSFLFIDCYLLYYWLDDYGHYWLAVDS